jgi:hypothetical protein
MRRQGRQEPVDLSVLALPGKKRSRIRHQASLLKRRWPAKGLLSCRPNALKGALLFRPWPYLVTTEMKFDQTEMNELEVPRVVQTRAGNLSSSLSSIRTSADCSLLPDERGRIRPTVQDARLTGSKTRTRMRRQRHGTGAHSQAPEHESARYRERRSRCTFPRGTVLEIPVLAGAADDPIPIRRGRPPAGPCPNGPLRSSRMPATRQAIPCRSG